MKYRRKLFFSKRPYDLEKTNDLFFKAMRENFAYQNEKNKIYRKIAKGQGVCVTHLNSYLDLEKIPIIPTVIFKKHRLFTIPKNKVPVKVTSSGTGGVFSEIIFEASGLLLALVMVIKVALKRKLFSVIPCNYILMGYKPHKDNKTAVTKTAFGATLFSLGLRRSYALKYKGGKYEADLNEVQNDLLRFSKSKFPIRFMGFPSYTYFFLKMLEDKNISLKLKPGSKILLGGGWKQHYAQSVDKTELYRLAKKVLDISEENIIEFFGAVEHPILFCDCKYHRFHVPIYARVLIRDIETLKPLPYDNIGLLNLQTPMVKATPILSIMTDDLASLHNDKCPCGNTSPYLEIHGRVGLKDIKTCAQGAAEKISGVKL